MKLFSSKAFERYDEAQQNQCGLLALAWVESLRMQNPYWIAWNVRTNEKRKRYVPDTGRHTVTFGLAECLSAHPLVDA